MAETLENLKKENADLYRTQGQNAQRLLELMDTSKTQEQTIATLTHENAESRATASRLTVLLQDSQSLVKEKDNTIQILHDELAAHQLELGQKEEQLRTSEARCKQLEAENMQLVDRWMLLKQEEAAKMNEANEFVET
ncbi:hypothetical protein HDV00_012688 [Rhizophlyctis rosea]|nr:hypothetical protein HDV00_012688 [Rhizophlyctis rosea]